MRADMKDEQREHTEEKKWDKGRGRRKKNKKNKKGKHTDAQWHVPGEKWTGSGLKWTSHNIYFMLLISEDEMGQQSPGGKSKR